MAAARFFGLPYIGRGGVRGQSGMPLMQAQAARLIRITFPRCSIAFVSVNETFRVTTCVCIEIIAFFATWTCLKRQAGAVNLSCYLNVSRSVL